MLGRSLVLVAWSAILAGNAAAQSPAGTPAEKAPAPLRMDFSALTPEATFDIPGPRDFAASGDAMWVVGGPNGAVSRIDPSTNKVAATIALKGESCAGPAADFGALLVPRCGPPGIERINAKSNAVEERLVVKVEPTANSIATGVGSVWVITDRSGTVARLDPVVGITVAEVYAPPGSESMVFGEGGLWIASPERNLVTRINPYNNLIVETIEVPKGPSHLAVGEGAVWSWNREDGSVSRIDPRSNTVTATIAAAAPAGGVGRVAVLAGSVWVATGATALTRIDPRTNRVAQIFTGAGVGSIAAAHDSLWMAAPQGGVLRLDPRRVEATRPTPGSGPVVTEVEGAVSGLEEAVERD